MVFFKKKDVSGGEEENSQGEAVPSYPHDRRRAERFFGHAKAVADTRNYDYAIECYINGLKFEPDKLDVHEALREVGLKRKVNGGKPAGMFDKVPVKGKHPVEKMLEAEYKWAKDSLNAKHALESMENAIEAELNEVGWWIGQHVLEANQAAKKPDKSIFIKCRDLYAQIGAYEKAVDACRLALLLDRNNPVLLKEMKDLEAEKAMVLGKYGQDGGFQDSVRDAKKQTELVQQDTIAKTDDVKDQIITRSRHAFEENPEDADVAMKLIRALLDKEIDEHENEAIELLKQLHASTGQYRFKVQVGDVKMKQFKRAIRVCKQRLQANPGEERLKNLLRKLVTQQLKFELAEYIERIENYPTDMSMRYELGRRQMVFKDYDSAIASFQEARADPKYRAASLRFLGEAFAAKEWFDEAIDTFREGIEAHASGDDRLALSLRFDLMRSLEGKARRSKDVEIAQEASRVASQIAQVNINYHDIRKRVESLRALVDELRKND